MGNAFPTARLTITWMPMAGAEVGGATLDHPPRPIHTLTHTHKLIHLFIPFSPQPATAPAPPAGDPQYPTAPCVLVGSSCTRASVWRPVGRVSTLKTTPATVRTGFFSTILGFKLEELTLVTDEWTRTTCLCKASLWIPVGFSHHQITSQAQLVKTEAQTPHFH